MAAASPGSRGNAEWGFKPSDSNRVKVATVSVGFLKGDIGMSIPREYAYMQLDQDILDIDAVCIKKSWLVDFATDEMVLDNLQTPWDNDAESGGVLTVDDDMRGVVALDVYTLPPNQDGGDTRTIALPLALSIGDGAYALPSAKNGLQNAGVQFKALAAVATGLLGTVTDAYA